MNQINFCKTDDITDYINENIKKVLLKRRNLNSNSELVATKYLTQCDRRIVYRVNGVKIDDVFSIKEEFEKINKRKIQDKWISILKDIDNITSVKVNEQVGDNNYNLISFIDVLKIGDKYSILEVEEISKDVFEDIIIHGAKRNHIVNIMTEMWITNIKHGFLIYDNIDDYIIYHVSPYSPIIKSICLKCSELLQYKILGKLPDRSYKEIKDECLVCEYKEKCWKN